MRGMRLPFSFGLIILAGLTVMVLAAPPTWTDPTTDAAFSLASTECSVMYHKITELTADSTDATTVYISIVSQSPNDGVFTQGVNPVNSNDILECTAGSVTTSTYTVVVRAEHTDGNGESDDLTLTITFTDQVSGPTWTSGTSQSLDKGSCTACNTVAALSATSTDSTSVTYSLVSQTPSGGFSVSGSTLSCTYASVAASSYTVVVSAQNTGDSAETQQTITVTVTDSVTGGPTWVTGMSHTLDKSDSNACNSVVTLSATSTDCTSVTYSFVSQSADGGFSVSGSNLVCNLASISASSYTVVVRAQNTGDSATTDQTLTITVTESGGGHQSGSGGSSSGGSSDGWKIGVGVTLGVLGVAALVVGGIFGYKFLCQKRTETVNPEKRQMTPYNDKETPVSNTIDKPANEPEAV